MGGPDEESGGIQAPFPRLDIEGTTDRGVSRPGAYTAVERRSGGGESVWQPGQRPWGRPAGWGGGPRAAAGPRGGFVDAPPQVYIIKYIKICLLLFEQKFYKADLIA